jgi:hypothetical protein
MMGGMGGMGGMPMDTGMGPGMMESQMGGQPPQEQPMPKKKKAPAKKKAGKKMKKK